MTSDATDLLPPEESQDGRPDGSLKPYQKPEIIHELELETRAGSPVSLPDPLDPLETK